MGLTIVELVTGKEIHCIGMWREDAYSFHMLNQPHSLFDEIEGIEEESRYSEVDMSIVYKSVYQNEKCPQHPESYMVYEEGEYRCSECKELAKVWYTQYRLPDGYAIK